jgi:phage terminase small subunit
VKIKKQKFVEAYTELGHDATKAARHAGYSQKSAARIGSRFVTKDKEVMAAIEQAKKQSEKASVWNVDRVIEALEENMKLAKSLEKPDCGAINKSLEQISKLNNLNPPDKLEAKVNAENKTEHVMTFVERKMQKVK